jgi:hypothetical protein
MAEAALMASSPVIAPSALEPALPIAPTNLLALDLKLVMDPTMTVLDTDAYTLNNAAQHSTTDYTHLQSMQMDMNTSEATTHSDQMPSTSTHTNIRSSSPPLNSTHENDDNGVEDNDDAIMNEKGKFLNVEQKKKFNEWIGQHSDNLYPTRDEKLGLAKLLGATYLQVNFY